MASKFTSASSASSMTTVSSSGGGAGRLLVPHQHLKPPFSMLLPAPGCRLPWGNDGGYLQVDADTFYKTPCRVGEVLRAQFCGPDGSRGPLVGLKVMDKRQAAHVRDDWRDEVAALERLQPRGLSAAQLSPHFSVWDYMEDASPDGNVYIATGWADGGALYGWAQRQVRTLQQLDAQLRAQGEPARHMIKWRNQVIPRLVEGMLAGLVHMHSRSTPVVHLDLDPVNVMMSSPDLDTAFPIFIDFGSSRQVDKHGTVGDSGIKWKKSFAAPQVLDFGKGMSTRFLGQPADVWSLGTIVWWLIMLPAAVRHREVSPRIMVDDDKLWAVNLHAHIGGDHAGFQASMELHKQRVQTCRDAVGAMERAMQVANQRAAAAEAVLLQARQQQAAAGAGGQQRQWQQQQQRALVEATAAAQEAVAMRNQVAGQLRVARHEWEAHRQVPMPMDHKFREGECLLCRWQYRVPSEWLQLIRHLVAMDAGQRPTAAVALKWLRDDILEPLRLRRLAASGGAAALAPSAVLPSSGAASAMAPSVYRLASAETADSAMSFTDATSVSFMKGGPVEQPVAGGGAGGGAGAGAGAAEAPPPPPPAAATAAAAAAPPAGRRRLAVRRDSDNRPVQRHREERGEGRRGAKRGAKRGAPQPTVSMTPTPAPATPPAPPSAPSTTASATSVAVGAGATAAMLQGRCVPPGPGGVLDVPLLGSSDVAMPDGMLPSPPPAPLGSQAPAGTSGGSTTVSSAEALRQQQQQQQPQQHQQTAQLYPAVMAQPQAVRERSSSSVLADTMRQAFLQ